jgi:hypothetical protein
MHYTSHPPVSKPDHALPLVQAVYVNPPVPHGDYEGFLYLCGGTLHFIVVYLFPFLIVSPNLKRHAFHANPRDTSRPLPRMGRRIGPTVNPLSARHTPGRWGRKVL